MNAARRAGPLRSLPRGSSPDPPPLAARGKTVRGQRTRERLLRASEKVFGEVGFYEARVSEITREAGVAAGTFYLYFHSKEELFRALIRAINHDLRRTLSEGTDHLPSRAEAEVRGFEIFFYEFLPKHRKLYRIIKQAEFADPPLFEWYYRRLAAGYARRLREAMDRGELRSWDEDVAACALLGIADFVAMRYVTWGRGLPRKKLHELMEFVLSGLVADGVHFPEGVMERSLRSSASDAPPKTSRPSDGSTSSGPPPRA